MLKKMSNGCVKLVSKYLPDPFLFCVILTLIVFIGAIPATKENPINIITAWGNGVWGLLAFSMQMALVLVLGSAFASAPIIKKGIEKIAGLAKTPFQAILLVTGLSTIACWINWGFGLIVGALIAKELARKVEGVDYRLLIASAYSGFVIWHAGISGSIPLALATPGEAALQKATGGVVSSPIPITQTILSVWNLLFCLVVLIAVPLMLAKLHPAKQDAFIIDPALLKDKPIEIATPKTPAEKLENCAYLSWIVVLLGFIFLIRYFAKNGLNGLNLNTVNFIFLILGILVHKTPIRYVKAITEAAKGSAGIILQFPFYAGIQALMVYSGTKGGSSLAAIISTFFVHISNKITFPIFTFLSAGIVNFFVPSGGGQWAVQGPIMMPAGVELGVSPSVTGMAIAWGDAWTNMVQPFWALPALGIAGLGARDIMGYCVMTLLLSGLIICLGFVCVGFFV